MQCANCSFDNPDNMKFCGQCGAALQLSCPQCDFENPPHFKFCGNCGGALPESASLSTEPTPLQQPAPPAPDATETSVSDSSSETESSPRESRVADRRQLTVLFCDLAGSTSLSGRLDPEDLREVIRSYQAVCSDVIARYGGHIAQYQGDGILVYFGYPQAHEYDAQHAVRSGLDIITEMARLNEQLNRDYQVKLALRVGIHTGMAVVGEMGTGHTQSRLAMGETPVIAAGIEGAVPHNSVGVSGTTHQLVQDVYSFIEMGDTDLKGVDTPVSVYQVSGEKEAVYEEENIGVPFRLTSLVGREMDEMLLQERWDEVKEGYGHVVVISGEGGIGKSRLVHGMKEHVGRNDGTWLMCRCSPYHQHTSLYPVIDLWNRIFGIRPDDVPEDQFEKLEKGLALYLDTVPDIVPIFASLLSIPTFDKYPSVAMGAELQRQKTQEAVLSILLKMEQASPVLLIVEDLQWIDPTTLALLNLIVDQGPTARLLTVGTCRQDFTSPSTDRTHVTHMKLQRLPRNDIEDMVRQLTDGKMLPSEVTEQIVSKTDGVPLFVEELCKMIIGSGLLQEQEDRYVLSGPLPPLAIPATLQDSLMARLDSLTSVKEVIQVGATFGRSFSFELMLAITNFSEQELQTELGRLVEAELLFQQGIPPQAAYHFKHTLIQETAYQSLLKSTRQQYHMRIARALETRFPDMAATQPEVLAHHYTASGLSEQAVTYWLQAGKQAVHHSASDEAIAHFRKGLAVVSTLPDSPERTKAELEMQISLGPVIMALKGPASQDVEGIYARARSLCREMGETEHVFPALWGIWRFHLNRGELETARDVSDRLLYLAGKEKKADFLLEAHMAHGTTLSYLGELETAHNHFEAGLKIYDDHPDQSLADFYGGCDPGVYCRSYSALSLWRLGYPDKARQRSIESVDHARDIGHPYSRVFALHYAAVLHRYRREADEVRKYAEAEIALATGEEYPVWMSLGTILLGWARAEQGDLKEGIELMQEGLEGYLSTGASLARPWLGLLTEAYGKVGELDKALSLIDEALDAIAESHGRYWESELYCLKGELHRQGGNEQEAETSFNHAIEVARNQHARSLEIRPVISLSNLLREKGQSSDARQLLSGAYEQFTEGFDAPDLLQAKDLLDQLE